MNNRQNMRIAFSSNLPVAKYKLISKELSVDDAIFDASIIDLSVSGAQMTGPLPEKHIYNLGAGVIRLGCNLVLKDAVIKTLATLKWFKSTGCPGEFSFGVEFEKNEATRQEIQKFLIRHQLDTRKLTRIKQ